MWGSWPDIYYYLTITVLLLWGALSNERTRLSFVYAACPCERSLVRVRRPRRRWEVNINIDFTEIRWGDMDCIYLAQDGDPWKALVNMGEMWLTAQVKVKVTLRLTVSKSWYRAPSGAYDQIFICLTVAFLFPWGALSDERTGLSFVCAAGPCQRSLSRLLVPWDLRPYFTVSDLRRPFSSPPTTRRVTVEVFDPASTRVWLTASQLASSYTCQAAGIGITLSKCSVFRIRCNCLFMYALSRKRVYTCYLTV
jgi:hypothetical protein